ncbi:MULTISPECIES: hypothetical protein [Amycolatopsis]|uniref:Uncharacterized protein n=1 Tax=Amycolatopsis thermalba TaxID=944492 RepID=A0ABY4NLZ3_9PSEU|nr:MULTISPECIES: hypothetical protein [Amycolatopsis]OXM70794.1 hypothetical protein CF166_20935 [Amycolatopsis sp. KNN50.9b]UQS21450.1 hypothetical protein L1857_00710 [Amycolatopsis thermalba]
MTSLETMSEREFFANVGRRPGMFVERGTYHAISSFITGYDQHAMRNGGGWLREFHDWVLRRRGLERSPLVWSAEVLWLAFPDGAFRSRGFDLTADENAHAINVLFELLDESLAEREAADDAPASA